ncbi:hypothetical protein HPB48_018283 [Haemaphysalis longicornis]|uniref:Uncharacterized protein n=1 Tax=Haemaphysalis longicornis TaxID=44386 RepID=A0A9J6G826_HAELO|nr:hypothetical protein HPB48_018283 [Haemaphysalis longicornis]
MARDKQTSQRFWHLPTAISFFRRFESCNLQRISSSGRCAVSLWSAISSHGLGPLVRIEGRFNAAAYEDIVYSVVIPYALDGAFADGL